VEGEFLQWDQYLRIAPRGFHNRIGRMAFSRVGRKKLAPCHGIWVIGKRKKYLKKSEVNSENHRMKN
jgi:hypothetical protein